MSSLGSVFGFLLDYCARQGSACPLVLVFLLCRLQPASIHLHSVLQNTHRKISLFLSRLDLTGHKSLLHQFPDLQHANQQPALTPSSSYTLSVMKELYGEKLLQPPLDQNTYFEPFLTSDIWNIQQDFYLDANLDAWDTVPFQISSNAYVAEQYASEVERIIRESYDLQGQSEKCICFVEIGAGHGILSFLLAKQLQSRRLKGLVICTDFHDAVFLQLLQLPWIRDICASGYLDFAVCGATSSDTVSSSSTEVRNGLQLLYRGVNTAGGTIRSDVLVIVGNYAFDSFPTELIVGTQQGELYQIGMQTSHSSEGDGQPLLKSRVKDAMKLLRMRQLCPFCVQPLTSSLEISHNSCQACEKFSLSTAAGEDAVLTTQSSLLYRLLSHMTRTFVNQGCVENFDERKIQLPTGVFAVPVSAAAMLQRIASSFHEVEELVLLAGDCFVSHDDSRWQGEEFEIYANHMKSKFDEDHHHDFTLRIPFFDPPLVSPHDSALAVPVSVHGLWAAFNETCQVSGKLSKDVISTSLHLADFSVVKFSGKVEEGYTTQVSTSHQQSGLECLSRHHREISFTLFDSYDININDYSTLRQLLTQDKEIAALVTLEAIEELIIHSRHDLSSFIDLRWLAFEKLYLNSEANADESPVQKKRKVEESKTQSTQNVSAVDRWLHMGLLCMRAHYCMSWMDYICTMALMKQWLIALSCERSLKECLLLFRDSHDKSSSQSTELDVFLAHIRGSDIKALKSGMSSNMKHVTAEVVVLELLINIPPIQDNACEQKLMFSIYSWQDAVMLAVCCKKLGHIQLSCIVAQHLWEKLQSNRGKYQERLRPFIFSMRESDEGKNFVFNKHDLRRFAQLRKRLRNLCHAE